MTTICFHTTGGNVMRILPIIIVSFVLQLLASTASAASFGFADVMFFGSINYSSSIPAVFPQSGEAFILHFLAFPAELPETDPGINVPLQAISGVGLDFYDFETTRIGPALSTPVLTLYDDPTDVGSDRIFADAEFESDPIDSWGYYFEYTVVSIHIDLELLPATWTAGPSIAPGFASLWPTGNGPTGSTIVFEHYSGERFEVNASIERIEVYATPEPSTALLLGLGLIGVGAQRRRARGA